LFNKIDSLPTGPKWEVIELSVEGRGVNDDGVVTEKVELWRRDPVECIRELFSNPAFTDKIHYKPQKVYTDESRTERVYDEMWTGQWWWKMQVWVLSGWENEILSDVRISNRNPYRRVQPLQQ
jgi:hypothetical protein